MNNVKEILSKIEKNLDNLSLGSRVVVAMSGGVDSSVAAAVLKHMGYDVIGVTLQLYDSDSLENRKGACCAGIDIYDAQMVAQKIGIKHYVFNYKDNFFNSVVSKFIDSYENGETPIPCILCNQTVKFEDLLKAATLLDASCMVTGHYVRKISKNNACHLLKGISNLKDQSYFLFSVTKEQLSFLRFPLGNLEKTETRMLAEYFKLDVAKKRDSQDICFVPNGNYRDVIRKYRSDLKKGSIVHVSSGAILGEHAGIVNYTIGQRRGIGIQSKEPLYVVKLEAATNTVFVGERCYLSTKIVHVRDINWLAEDLYNIDSSFHTIDCTVKLRSAHKGTEASIRFNEKDYSTGIVTLFSSYDGVTPGQACVMYDGDRMLGGGWIVKIKE
ncbi:tRNA-specific 2-thiouridylase MnmA [Candidatus Fokinia solitaria]|uniref:tRNA-specific 2-thiouridylase MnmA n=1 Tax=Candidatus Fokinia solitaria TaxID=1802984 RepID=A0A2U8BSL5_9RICK|nr:tRNA 2-thiouridine(34) synthase MnmA [Candidatus Fokinia solitaria]AWD33327.1 tRNA-specific 2-thiouridylase MnmA [Candidatus Fokinia solitaria]